MKKRVLVFADNANRDLLATRLVEKALQRRGVETLLATQNETVVKFRQFKPHAFVSSRGNLPIATQARQCCRVYIVPSEGAQLTPETMLTVFMGRSFFQLTSVEWIRRCYLWSENVRHWLLQTGLFKEEQLLVAGNARLDVYRRYQHPPRKPGEFVLGVAISAKGTSQHSGPLHYAETYFDFHPETCFPVTAPGRHFEDILWRDHAILRRTMRYLRRFLDTSNARIVFRPSPFEDIREYRFLERRYPGRVRVEGNQPLIDFVSSVDAVLTCWSTAGLEALVAGVPVISMARTIDQDFLFQHISEKAGGFQTFVPFYHQPDSEEALFQMLGLAAEGRLPVSPRTDAEVAELLHTLYNWPFAAPASEVIADDLARDLDDVKEATAAQWRNAFPLPRNMPLWFAPLAYSVKTPLSFLRKGAYSTMRDYYRTRDARVEALVSEVEADVIREPQIHAIRKAAYQ